MAFGPSLHERGRGDERPVASGRGGAGNVSSDPAKREIAVGG